MSSFRRCNSQECCMKEHIEPILGSRFPDLKYAAASYGMCSEKPRIG